MEKEPVKKSYPQKQTGIIEMKDVSSFMYKEKEAKASWKSVFPINGNHFSRNIHGFGDDGQHAAILGL